MLNLLSTFASRWRNLLPTILFGVLISSSSTTRCLLLASIVHGVWLIFVKFWSSLTRTSHSNRVQFVSIVGHSSRMVNILQFFLNGSLILGLHFQFLSSWGEITRAKSSIFVCLERCFSIKSFCFEFVVNFGLNFASIKLILATITFLAILHRFFIQRNITCRRFFLKIPSSKLLFGLSRIYKVGWT